MTDPNIQMYLVGGAVRDRILGVPTKDYDYTVVVNRDLGFSAADAWVYMLEHLIAEGYEIFKDDEPFFTVRARFPKGHEHRKLTADFVLAREEGPYSDGRHPDWVKPGLLLDDLGRRDFTVNAMAIDEWGGLIDVFGGMADLENKRLRAVGRAKNRLDEDALRAFRALRFSITKGLRIDAELDDAMNTVGIIDKMRDVSVERIREELQRCFAHDTLATVEALVLAYPDMLAVAVEKGIWLEPTLKSPKGSRPVKEPVNTNGVCTGFGGTK